MVRQTVVEINSLWPSDAIWRDRPWSALVEVIAGCLTATSHCPNQFGLVINEVLWHSPTSNFTSSVQATILYKEFQYNDVIMTMMASQITSLTVVYSIVYSDVEQENITAPRHWPL